MIWIFLLQTHLHWCKKSQSFAMLFYLLDFIVNWPFLYLFILYLFISWKVTCECIFPFRKAGLVSLVEYNDKKTFEVKLKEMKSALTTQIAEEADISEVIENVKQHVKDAKLPDSEVMRILWDVLMDAVQWSGKNQQQNANSALRQVCYTEYYFSLCHFKSFPLLSFLCTTVRSIDWKCYWFYM